ncbi:hypothetical protein Ahy_B10g101863 isoform F [Arachis hypogaea]|uniref:Uncharacterized protein n=1 Tax=Arachis hypogaea TaxID=3818 RepID=A0A444X0K4_ARAHY|nr:hypothetical protein Ahy_B10g101863 isoform F [Arachis hypogaea]
MTKELSVPGKSWLLLETRLGMAFRRHHHRYGQICRRHDSSLQGLRRRRTLALGTPNRSPPLSPPFRGRQRRRSVVVSAAAVPKSSGTSKSAGLFVFAGFSNPVAGYVGFASFVCNCWVKV